MGFSSQDCVQNQERGGVAPACSCLFWVCVEVQLCVFHFPIFYRTTTTWMPAVNT